MSEILIRAAMASASADARSSTAAELSWFIALLAGTLIGREVNVIVGIVAGVAIWATINWVYDKGEDEKRETFFRLEAEEISKTTFNPYDPD